MESAPVLVNISRSLQFLLVENSTSTSPTLLCLSTVLTCADHLLPVLDLVLSLAKCFEEFALTTAPNQSDLLGRTGGTSMLRQFHAPFSTCRTGICTVPSCADGNLPASAHSLAHTLSLCRLVLAVANLGTRRLARIHLL